jgi:hypothetical protein
MAPIAASSAEIATPFLISSSRRLDPMHKAAIIFFVGLAGLRIEQSIAVSWEKT